MKRRHVLCLLMGLLLLATVTAAGAADASPETATPTAAPMPAVAPAPGNAFTAPAALTLPNIPTDSTTRLWNNVTDFGTGHPDDRPAIAANAVGGHLLVHEQDDGASDNIRGQYIDWGGTASGSSFEIAGGSKDESFPAVAYDGNNDRFLVVWTEEQCMGIPQHCNLVIRGRVLYGTHQSGSQFAGDAFTIATELSTISDGYDLFEPSVAFNADDGQYMVAFIRGSTATGFHAVHGQMVGAHASSPTRLGPPEGFAIRTVATEKMEDTHLAWSSSGDTFLLVWQVYQSIQPYGVIAAAYLHDTYQGGNPQLINVYGVAPVNSGDYPLTEACYAPSVVFDPYSGVYSIVFSVSEENTGQRAIFGQWLADSDTGAVAIGGFAYPIETELTYPDSDYYRPAIALAQQGYSHVFYAAYHTAGGDVYHLYDRMVRDREASGRVLVRTSATDRYIGPPGGSCSFSLCQTVWAEDYDGDGDADRDIMGRLIGPAPYVWFDEGHDEQNTMFWDRAEELSDELPWHPDPEWLYFGRLRTTLYDEFDLRPQTGAFSELEQYQALIMSVPRESLTTAELIALKRFVADGGGLILIGDCGFTPPNPELTAEWGINFNSQCLFSPVPELIGDLEITSFSGHAAVEGVSRWRTNWGQSLELSGTAQAVAWTDADAWEDSNDSGDYDNGVDRTGIFPVVAISDTGCGHVVAIADNTFQDGSFAAYNGDELMRGLLGWATSGSSCELWPDIYVPVVIR